MITQQHVILYVGCSQRSLRCAWHRKPKSWKKGHCADHEGSMVEALLQGAWGMSSSWERTGSTWILGLAWQTLSFCTDMHWTTLGCRPLELFSLGSYHLAPVCAQDRSSSHPTRWLCLKSITKKICYSFLLGLFGDLISYFRTQSNLWSFYSPNMTFYLDGSVDQAIC